jgi:bacterioferritin
MEALMQTETFLKDVQTLMRHRAQQHIDEGAVAPGGSAHQEVFIKLLNDALATELVCVLRYRRHHFLAKASQSKSIADMLLEHSNEEQGHADEIAERIVQLGGEPNFSPDGLVRRSHAEYMEGGSLVDMMKDGLVAERIVIDSYHRIIQYLGDKDPTTKRMLEGIVAAEEKHVHEMADLLEALPPEPKHKRGAPA